MFANERLDAKSSSLHPPTFEIHIGSRKAGAIACEQAESVMQAKLAKID